MKLKWHTFEDWVHSIAVINTYLPIRVTEISTERMGLGKVTIVRVGLAAPVPGSLAMTFKAAEFKNLYYSGRISLDHLSLTIRNTALADDVGTNYFYIRDLLKQVKKRRGKLSQLFFFVAVTRSSFLQQHALFDKNIVRGIVGYF